MPLLILLDEEFAYRGSDESIYFSISKFSNYGCLSHLKLDELKAGASERLGVDEYEKENAADFALWKAYDPERDGSIYWESPFGKGRPGWHIECSAMSMDLLGETIDIHVGGIDNLFPHHENEIAQSEACSGKQFVKMWLHSEHLLVEQKKMSKSTGNFYTLKDILGEGYSGSEVRLMLLSCHYRTQLNFTFQGLAATRASLKRLLDCVQRLRNIVLEDVSYEVFDEIKTARRAFQDALFDDLNISEGLATLFGFIRKVNHLCDQGKMGIKGVRASLDFLFELDSVLGRA
jgi:cysteinyl-tRNA synthetase